MANKSGWWRLVISNDDVELDECDYNHISELIGQGYTEGEICQTLDEEDEEN